MLERIHDRYLAGYVRDDQLDRYVALGVVTPEQAQAMRDEKNPVE